MQDDRFSRVLERIEAERTTIGDQRHRDIGDESGIGKQQLDLDKQLFNYFKAFTSGSAWKIVDACGRDRVYEAYRQLCEIGRSRRPEHLAAMRLKVMNPKGAPLAGLLVAIAEWEKEYVEFAKIMRTMGKDFSMDEEDQRLILLNMCPADLHDRLLKEGDRYDTYHKARAEIVEAIAVSRRPKAGIKQIGAVEAAQWDGGDQNSGRDQDLDYGDLDDEERQYIETLAQAGPEFQASVCALVRNTKFKAFKGGKGKGKKGDQKDTAGASDGKGPNDKGPQCFNCKEFGHMQRDCPQPRRPKGDGGKGDKGDGKKGGQWPNQAQWNRTYPFPSQRQWADYYSWGKGNGGGKGDNGVNSVSEDPTQSGSWVDVLKANGKWIGHVGAPKRETSNAPPDIESGSGEPLESPLTSCLAKPQACNCCRDREIRQVSSQRADNRKTRMKNFEDARNNRFAPLSTSDNDDDEENIEGDGASLIAAQTMNYLGVMKKEAAINALNENPTGNWEPMEVIMDSGAHISVGPPKTGESAGYSVEESPDSRAGVTYTAANGSPIPNLGQRIMAVMTEEGSVRGMVQQVADVTKDLEAIRAVLKTGHAVIFNDDGTGNGHGSFMVHKQTGEINVIHDNGLDYIMRRWIIPKQDVDNTLAHEAAASGFTRHGSS